MSKTKKETGNVYAYTRGFKCYRCDLSNIKKDFINDKRYFYCQKCYKIKQKNKKIEEAKRNTKDLNSRDDIWVTNTPLWENAIY